MQTTLPYVILIFFLFDIISYKAESDVVTFCDCTSIVIRLGHTSESQWHRVGPLLGLSVPSQYHECTSQYHECPITVPRVYYHHSTTSVPSQYHECTSQYHECTSQYHECTITVPRVYHHSTVKPRFIVPRFTGSPDLPDLFAFPRNFSTLSR